MSTFPPKTCAVHSRIPILNPGCSPVHRPFRSLLRIQAHRFRVIRGFRAIHVIKSESMDDAQRWLLAWARFEALRTNQPRTWDESEVARYNDIVTALEEACPGEDLSAFRVPDSELKHKVVSFTLGTYRRPGRTNMSSGRYCNEDYMRRQIEGIFLYFHTRQPSPPPMGFA